MKILFLFQDFPFPPNNGIRITLFNILKNAIKKSKCDVLCFGEPSENDLKGFKAEFPKVELIQIFSPNKGLGLRLRQLLSMFTNSIPSVERFKNKNYLKRLDDVLGENEYDLIHFDLLNLAPYRIATGNIPTILSANDAISLYYRKMSSGTNNAFKKNYYDFLASKIARFEKYWYPKFDQVRVVSDLDKSYYREQLGLRNIMTVHITVEPSRFVASNKPLKREKTFNIFTSGAMHLPYIKRPILEFANTHWPKIHARFPDTAMTIVGRHGNENIKKTLEKIKGIKFFRFLANYHEVLKNSQLVLMFDRGGVGMKNRTIEAFSTSKIVLGYPEAYLGIEIENMKNCIVANNAEEFDESLIYAIENYKKLKPMGASAKNLISGKYSWINAEKEWNSLYAKALRTQHSRGSIEEISFGK